MLLAFDFSDLEAKAKASVFALTAAGREALTRVAGEVRTTMITETYFRNRTNAMRDSLTPVWRGALALQLVARARRASFLCNGTRFHTITAKKGQFLRFIQNGNVVFRRSVAHPGTRPLRFNVRETAYAEKRLAPVLSRATETALAQGGLT